MTTKGKLIVIEGLDGAGKATQTKLLLNRLKKQGCQTAIFDFPQYQTFFGGLVAKYLRGEFGKAEEVSPYFASLLYALDRWQIKEKIKRNLKEGKIIISNRYSTSNFLHQTPKIKNRKEKEKFLKWLENLEFKLLDLPQPNLVLYLKTPYHLGQKLVKRKKQRKYLNGQKFDIHEKSNNHLKSAEKNSFFLIRKYHWQPISCTRNGKILPKKEIANKIWLMVKKYL